MNDQNQNNTRDERIKEMLAESAAKDVFDTALLHELLEGPRRAWRKDFDARSPNMQKAVVVLCEATDIEVPGPVEKVDDSGDHRR